jgi:hypothetical protein
MVRRYQSSVMAWTPPEGRVIFNDFVLCPGLRMREWYGDQDWIGHIAPGCATFPPGWVAKREGPGVKVVINVKDHGQSKPSVSAASPGHMER